MNSVKAQLAGGTYFIGNLPGDDYTTIDDAVTDLNSGITGPIVFEIRAGDYSESVTINSVTGASSLNSVTVKAVDGDSVFWYTPISFFPHLSITDAAHIRIDGIIFTDTFTNKTFSNMTSLTLNDACEDVIIENNTFVTIDSTQAGINYSSSNLALIANNIIFRNNLFVGGNPIYVFNTIDSLYIIGNTFSQSFRNALSINSCNALFIESNFFTGSVFNYFAYKTINLDSVVSSVIKNNHFDLGQISFGNTLQFGQPIINIDAPSSGNYNHSIYNNIFNFYDTRLTTVDASKTNRVDFFNNTLIGKTINLELLSFDECDTIIVDNNIVDIENYNDYFIYITHANLGYKKIRNNIFFKHTLGINAILRVSGEIFDIFQVSDSGWFENNLYTDPLLSSQFVPYPTKKSPAVGNGLFLPGRDLYDFEGKLKSNPSTIGALDSTVQDPFIGTYIIGNQLTDDYTTASSAVADLNTYGMAGTVVFELRGETFVEDQITLGAIASAPDTSTITFKSEDGDTAIWQKSNTASRLLLLTDSAQNLLFDGIRFKGNEIANPLIELTNTLNNIQFTNSVFDAPQATEYIRGAFSTNALYDVKGLVIHKNTFLGGKTAISMDANTTSTVTITDNTFQDQEDLPVSTNSLDSLTIQGNSFYYAPINNTTNHAIVQSDGSRTAIIENNYFENTNSTLVSDTIYYLDFTQSVATADTLRAYVNNNIVKINALLNNAQAFYSNFIDQLFFTHNTVLSQSTRPLFSLSDAKQLINKNNIYFNQLTNTALLAFDTFIFDSLQLRENIFYHSNTSAPSTIQIASTDYTYADAVTNGYLVNNFYFDPVLNTNEVYPSPIFESGALKKGNTDTMLDSLDFFGYARNTPPTIGAIEYPTYNNWPWQVQSTAHYFPTSVAQQTIQTVSIEDSLQIGDYIGAFYRDTLGQLACAGYTAWHDSLIDIYVFQQMGNLPGVVIGDTPTFKIWRQVDSCDFIVADSVRMHENIGAQLIDSATVLSMAVQVPQIAYPSNWYCNSYSDTIDPILLGIVDTIIYQYIGNQAGMYLGQGQFLAHNQSANSFTMQVNAGGNCLKDTIHELVIVDSLPLNAQTTASDIFIYGQDSVDLSLSVDTTYYSVAWSTGDTLPAIEVFQSDTYTYQVQNKACADQIMNGNYKVTLIEKISYPIDSVHVNNPVCLYTGSAYLDPDKIRGGIAPYTLYMEKVDGGYNRSTTTYRPIFYDINEGEYVLQIFDSVGNSEVIGALNFKSYCSDLIISINGDKLNDFIYLAPKDASVSQAQLFDRDGHVVAELPVPTYWNGVNQYNEFLPTGAYLVRMGTQEVPVTIMR